MCSKINMYYLQGNTLEGNLVTVEKTSSTAALQEDGSVYCTPEILFKGWNHKLLSFVYFSNIKHHILLKHLISNLKSCCFDLETIGYTNLADLLIFERDALLMRDFVNAS